MMKWLLVYLQNKKQSLQQRQKASLFKQTGCFVSRDVEKCFHQQIILTDTQLSEQALYVSLRLALVMHVRVFLLLPNFPIERTRSRVPVPIETRCHLDWLSACNLVLSAPRLQLGKRTCSPTGNKHELEDENWDLLSLFRHLVEFEGRAAELLRKLVIQEFAPFIPSLFSFQVTAW